MWLLSEQRPLWSRHYDRLRQAQFSDDGKKLLMRERAARWSSSWAEVIDPWTGASMASYEVADISALTACPRVDTRQMVLRNGETVVESIIDGSAVAWFPTRFSSIACHPRGLCWAGGTRHGVWLLQLEAATNP
jgi:hypothetical protein